MSVWIVTDGNDLICGVFAQGVDIADCIRASTFKIKDVTIARVEHQCDRTIVYTVTGTYPEGGPYNEVIRAKLWPVYAEPAHL